MRERYWTLACLLQLLSLGLLVAALTPLEGVPSYREAVLFGSVLYGSGVLLVLAVQLLVLGWQCPPWPEVWRQHQQDASLFATTDLLIGDTEGRITTLP